mgnify:CR=1 FL=1
MAQPMRLARILPTINRMRRFALPAVLLCLSACADPGPSATAVHSHRGAIRNGTRAPQVVALDAGRQRAVGWLYAPATPAESFCTGTLVANRVVITARHCVEGRTAADLGFGVGEQPAQPEGLFEVIAVHAHPDRDAAVLVLAQDVREQVPAAVPITLNRVALDPVLVGRPVEVGGYGETGDVALTGRFFAAVRLVDIDDEYVAVDGEGRQGLCFGDSGGPVLMADAAGTPVLLGVEHGGESSCVGRDLLTRVDRLQEWMAEVIGDATKLAAGDEACGALDFRGRCAADVAEWCDENGRVARMDCGQYGRACGFIDDSTGFYCAEPGDACAGLGAAGTCTEGAARRCVGGVIQEDRCGEAGLACVQGPDGAVCGSPQALPERPGAGRAPGGATGLSADTPGSHLEGGCAVAEGRPGWAWGLLVLPWLRPRRRRRDLSPS